MEYESRPIIIASVQNGSIGSPGMIPMMASIAARIVRARG